MMYVKTLTVLTVLLATMITGADQDNPPSFPIWDSTDLHSSELGVLYESLMGYLGQRQHFLVIHNPYTLIGLVTGWTGAAEDGFYQGQVCDDSFSTYA